MISRRITPALLCALVLASLPLAAETNSAEQAEDAAALNVLVTIRVSAPDAPLKSYELLADGDGRKAHLMEGQRVPIPTTTFQTQSPPDVIVPLTSYTYQDVGFEVELSTRVMKDGRIKLDAQIEDSRLAGETMGAGFPVIQTRHQKIHGTLVESEPLRVTQIEEKGVGTSHLEISAEVLN